MGQKRAERLELPTQKSPAVSAYFGVWVRVWVKPNFESPLDKTKTPQTAVLRGFVELLSRFELETSSLPTHWDVSK